METLRYVLLANVLLAIVSTAYFVLLRRKTFFGANRLALWLGLIAAVTFPLMELPDWRPQPVRKVMQQTAQVILPSVLPEPPFRQPEVTITFPNGRTYPAFTTKAPSREWSWQSGLVTFYLLGVLLLLGRLGIHVASLARIIRRSSHEVYDSFTLVRDRQVTSPFSFFHWVVVNPDHHDPDELEQILRHERVHVRLWHSLDMLTAELVCILFWFNPAAYLFRHLLHQSLEFSADRAVLTEGVDTRAYQYSLVRVSLSTGSPMFANQFSGPTLRQRIAMMNRTPSSVIAWVWYVVWCALVGTMALACRHVEREESEKSLFMKSPTPSFPLTNATRVLAAELDKSGMPWFQQSSLLENENNAGQRRVNGKLINFTRINQYPELLCLRNNHLAVRESDYRPMKLFINGQESSPQSLSTITFEEVSDLLVYQKWEDAPEADKTPELFRIFISTKHTNRPLGSLRLTYKRYLEAAAISDNPLGTSNTFSMNKLLEATFFANKHAFVKRTKADFLTLYDDYTADIDTYINGIAVKPKQIESVHVREVDRLYTRERPFDEWTIDGPDRKHRFVLYILTTPKRAKRDSSYYVFSPFYTGDF
ncbi:M56 family metallopeptidase [Spirosoma agri]|uniref:M56 family metallopeptidase n=1 Tax=Spirosoma agri TaxID=1987381 RepID=A0A6M0IB64_9BACT|nr:M56 family metallopeptidase [Spirosoma agri]NEU65406.1 M56 family metallopeptidase [Spirosoma agri]